MRILLTGATGFVGQHLLQALLTEGHHVVCALRTPEARLPKSDDARLSYLHADFSDTADKAAWLARLSHVDAVINTVGIFKESGRQSFSRLHRETPRALFAACAESHDVQMVIQLSALGADRDAQTPYHLSKRDADDYLATLPLRSFIVQPSLIYGRDGASARTFRSLASMPFTLRLGSKPQLVQPIHIDDLVTAIVGLLKHRLPMMPGAGTSMRVALVGPQAMSFTEYLGLLRASMGMGRQRVVTLPGPLARLMRRDALRMRECDNTADVMQTAILLGHLPRAPSEFIGDPDGKRASAKLGWLLPMLRYSIAAVWILTALVSFGLYPVEASYDLLARTGVPPEMQPLVLYGAATVELLMGLGILLLARRRWLWLAQLGVIGVSTALIAFKLPELLLHPYGPLTKNLPMLAAIWLLYQLEEK